MTKFAVKTKTPVAAPVAPKGIIKEKVNAPETVTFEGAPAVVRKAKSELFLLAVTNMVGENTFYEKAEDRDARFEALVHKVTEKDPEWVARFVPYLRDSLHMRTASIVMAAEYVKAGGPNGRKVVDAALKRADEPSVMLAYWMSKYGRKIPQPVKRGVADAAVRLYNERSFIKWDSDSLSPRFGDVVELTHPKGQTAWQHDLFRYSMSKRHNREDLTRDIETLGVIKRHRELMALPVADRRELVNKAAETGDFSALEGAGLTWENLSGWLQGPMDAKAWEAIIPQMGYMALLRNLRNFDDAGISVTARNAVIAKLTDPEEVVKSRQLPLRFYSAYKNVASAHWTSAIETALDLTLANVPSFKGKTLVLVDVSGSMDAPFSGAAGNRKFVSGTAKYPLRWEIAGLFGSAVAVRAEKADMYGFSDSLTVADFRKGGSIMRTTEGFNRMAHGGTDTYGAIAKAYKDHDRIVILTDEQANYWGQSGSYAGLYGFQSSRSDRGAERAKVESISVPIYVFNLAGYAQGMKFDPATKHYAFGGLTDNGFKAMEALEAFKDEAWPF